ncbi:MAG: hypothetical protein [Bacteriophage sp.]|nr:MAG: hypothetical protein [Bacteriophage sp.]
MNYTIPKHVQDVIDAAMKRGIELTLVGGALRDAVLGGEVSDYDLVYFGCRDDMYIDIVDLDINLGFKLQHHSPYDGEDGFVFDMRKDDVNIIMYDSKVINHVEALIGKFDLNINQFQLENGIITNDYFDGTTVLINPVRDALGHTDRLGKRVQRFAAKYPDLDWSAPLRMISEDPVEKLFL